MPAVKLAAWAFYVCSVLTSMFCAPALHAMPPLLTGVVEDKASQTIDMPSLPGAWQRQIEWMAAEGSTVAKGEVIVRIAPGTLIEQEQQAETDLAKIRLDAQRQSTEIQLAIMDAQTAVSVAQAAVQLARIDATVPASNLAQLDYRRFQLTLQTAHQKLQSAQADLSARKAEGQGTEEVLAQGMVNAEFRWQELRDAIAETQIRADRVGLFIHGENPHSGAKIFVGETVLNNRPIAEVASREDLQFRFWVHEADIVKFPVGSPVIVTADALASQTVAATVNWTSKRAVARSDWSQGGYFELTALPNNIVPLDFIPGMAVMAEIHAVIKATGIAGQSL